MIRIGLTKILIVTIMMMSSIFFTYPQSTPLERCSSNGSRVCYDCSNYATCLDNGDGTYSLSSTSACTASVTTYCDDSLFSSGSYGQCSPLPASYTNCSCSKTSSCVADPNNPGTVLHCESNPPVSDSPCSVPDIDLTKCSCLSCSATCPLVDDPNDDCSQFYFCNGATLIPSNCSSPLCFEQDQCMCAAKTSSTTTLEPTSTLEPTTTTPEPTTTTPEPTTTTPEPTTTTPEPTTTTPELTTTTPEPSTTTPELSTTTPELSTTTPEATTTLEPTTTMHCTADCPYVDNPNDNCGKFFYCEGNTLVAHNCPGTLCYSAANCQCQ